MFIQFDWHFIEPNNSDAVYHRMTIIRGDNLPIVDLSKYHTEGKEAQNIQISHIVGKLTGNKKMTREFIKKAEFNSMLDLKSLSQKGY